MTHHVNKSAALLLLALPVAEASRPFLTLIARSNNRSFEAAMGTRGGGLFGGSKQEDEWEYYPDDGPSDQSEEVAENVLDEDIGETDSDEYEYYEGNAYGKVQDINGEFVSDSDAEIVEWEGLESEQENADSEEDEDEEYLLSTPIPSREKGVPSRSWFARPRVPVETESPSASETIDDEENMNMDENAEESDADEEADEEDELAINELAEEAETTPASSWFGRMKPRPEITEESETETLELEEAPPVQPKTKQPKAWFKPKSQTKKPKKPSRRSNKSILPRSSSGATFIYPVNKLSSMVQNLPSVSMPTRAGGRSIINASIVSISRMVTAIIQPMLLVLSTIFNSTTSFIGKWASIIMALLRQAVDALWYGPVDGVTTTGISRAGGLSGLIMSSPMILVASSVFVVGVVMLVRQQMIRTDRETNGNALANLFNRMKFREKEDATQDEEEDELYDSEDSEPSPEEELQFLNSFDAANPTSRQRISKKISKRRGLWPFNANQKPTPRQEKRQHQRSVKSIQKWWRQRPSNTVQIIEPSHVQQQPPMSQQVARLKNQLAQSEQERAVLQSDVARLQHRLQKAHHDAKAVISKNQWLEKQQS